MKIEWLTNRLIALEVPQVAAHIISILMLTAIVTLVAVVTTAVVRKTLLRFVAQWIEKKRFRWGAPLLHTNFFARVSLLIPLTIFALAIDATFDKNSTIYILTHRGVMTGFALLSILILTSLLTSIKEIDLLTNHSRKSAVQGYSDALKIIIYVMGVIFIISIFTGRSPWGIFSVLGGLTAVLLLVFKDSILGFVASLQLSASDMIRIGDWIEMDQYGANGDVISMSIHTVKVQNFDKTISTIPTYSLVSSSFTNWRGMLESQGRRIKRALLIDITSIRFCDENLMERLRHIELLQDYLEQKERDITAHNRAHPLISENVLNGRRQTNIGIFRAYAAAYLRNNPDINEDMTFMVRQLAPTNHGLPLEIYVFSRDQIWRNYEAIQADVFDHLLAAIAEFDLRLFQEPSGHDLQRLRFDNQQSTLQE
ncbi:MAG: mechanosensitive ion channel family protein [Desulfopila sp.]